MCYMNLIFELIIYLKKTHLRTISSGTKINLKVTLLFRSEVTILMPTQFVINRYFFMIREVLRKNDLKYMV